MFKPFVFLGILWLIWELRYVLFWLYLWQLKDYHIGRFIDHFSTHKGRKIFLNLAQAAKIVLFVLLLTQAFSLPLLFYALIFVYALEAVLFFVAIFTGSVRLPRMTFKIIFLTVISFGAVACLGMLAYSLQSSLLFLEFDILTPIIISAIVLAVQPFFVLLRNNTLQRAKSKIEKIKSVSGLKVIAITGSYGKTSTKEFLTTILSKKFKVLSTDKHQNSEIGVAKCILNDLKPNHKIFIAEVGAYNKGKVQEVCNMIKPKIGIVTGVNEQHMALFGSLENLLSAEGGGELASVLASDGTLVVSGDNKYCLDLYKKHSGNKKIYSLSNKVIDADIWADSITMRKDSILFVALDKLGNMAHFQANVLGKQNVQNLLGAILIAKELGMSFGEISEACKQIKEEQAGMTLEIGKRGIYVIDSSYSANPDGVFADLNYLSIFGGKKIVIMPCLIELGKKSSEIHEKIGAELGQVCDLAIITTKDKFKEIEKGFEQNKKNGAKCLLCDNANDIYSTIEAFCTSGDAVLLEGRVPEKLKKFLFNGL